MRVKYQNKPSDELIERFTRKIEEFLSSHDLKFNIELWDHHLGPISSYINNNHVEDIYLWVKRCTLRTPKLRGELEVDLFGQGLDETVTDEKIWHEAHHIQDQLYKHFKKDPGNPQDKDPYWNLWDKHPSKQNGKTS